MCRWSRRGHAHRMRDPLDCGHVTAAATSALACARTRSDQPVHNEGAGGAGEGRHHETAHRSQAPDRPSPSAFVVLRIVLGAAGRATPGGPDRPGPGRRTRRPGRPGARDCAGTGSLRCAGCGRGQRCLTPGRAPGARVGPVTGASPRAWSTAASRSSESCTPEAAALAWTCSGREASRRRAGCRSSRPCRAGRRWAGHRPRCRAPAWSTAPARTRTAPDAGRGPPTVRRRSGCRGRWRSRCSGHCPGAPGPSGRPGSPRCRCRCRCRARAGAPGGGRCSGSQPAQRVLYGAHDPATGVAPLVGVVAHRVVEFRGSRRRRCR